MSIRKLSRLFVTVVLTLTAGLTLSVATTQTARADGCYTWSGTLREGASGEGVTRLQIRVAGWVPSGSELTIDGQFGPATKTAVTNFQRGYGLTPDGVAGPQTFAKIYELQDDDCTPIHFSFAEVTQNCGRGANGYTGGAVSPAEVRENLLRGMWRAEALRHQLGDRPIRVTSGFRDRTCNASVDGASNSRHLYGDALDFGAGAHSLCTLAQGARSAGFQGIYGPGFPAHNDHVHVSASERWSAPSCGI